MDLIHFDGLNCHLSCVINIAHAMGLDYLKAFSTLWSETDFADENKYNIYVSKRVFVNLKAIGLITKTINYDETGLKRSIPRISDGEFFLIGMDIFNIPWHPVFGYFHGPHYFFVKKETAELFACFDPIYKQKNIKLKPCDIFPYIFELSRFNKKNSNPPKNPLKSEAEAVLLNHSKIKKELSERIQNCKKEGKAVISILIKQIMAMINNRHMFSQFLHNSMPDSKKSFFTARFFLKWEAAKNGLYKALILKDNKAALDEVKTLISGLMQEEIIMAKNILKKYFKTSAAPSLSSQKEF